MTATTLYSFTGTGSDGANPYASVTLDAAGDIFGTTFNGGADGFGSVYEIKAGATTATTLYSFAGTGTDGANPYAGVKLDAAGDIFGSTLLGGEDGKGAVYEIKAGATTATTLYSFTGTGTDGAFPYAGVTLDAAGDIFGTTEAGGAEGDGEVYEIKAGAKTATTLYSFTGTGTDGAKPQATVTLDAAGDIFGTTFAGGAEGDGEVYEIKAGAKTATTLYSFTGTGSDGAHPYAGVTLDAAGDIFGTTLSGGADGDGVVYEIAAGATTATTIFSFSQQGAAYAPQGGVTLDAEGDIFGTTLNGGPDGDGAVYEIKAGAGPRTAITLCTFTTSGNQPQAGVTLNAAGDIFGTTYEGGDNGDGMVFEIANSGYIVPHVAQDFNGDGTSDILLQNSAGALVDWIATSGAITAAHYLGTAAGWSVAGTGDFNGDGTADVLMQSGGTVVDWGMKNGVVATAAVVGNTSGYAIVGTGDFSGNGTSDILLQNSSGALVDWMMNDGAVQTGNYLATAAGWKVVGTGDFTGNGVDDILLQNSAGIVVDWTMQNGVVSAGALVGQAGGYNVVGTGDFSGNGTADILLQDGAGDLVDWMMSNGAVTAAHYLGTAAGWTVAAIGDYTGNGVSDILLTNGGNAVDWTMANGVVSGASLIGNTSGFAIKY